MFSLCIWIPHMRGTMGVLVQLLLHFACLFHPPSVELPHDDVRLEDSSWCLPPVLSLGWCRLSFPCSMTVRPLIWFWTGVLNLCPIKHPRVIKQSNQTPSWLQQRQIRQNLHGVCNRHTFSSGIGCQKITILENSTVIQVPLEIFPWTPGGSRTPDWEPLV